ncbi:hypothetical protein R1flu_020701 [Riccia fluitans]|uniref:RING-type E3 ubiquitin transferase n=1 Tax=Riccia fluitans TaxID=41844 RepID=A0ABD1ZM89_9MARC
MEVAMQRDHLGGGGARGNSERKLSLGQRAKGKISRFLGTSSSKPQGKASGSSQPWSNEEEDFGPRTDSPKPEVDDDFAPGSHSGNQSVGNHGNQSSEFDSGRSRNNAPVDDYPDEFVCPVTKKLMADPVNVGSGISYERVVIELYFQKGYRKCIKTGMMMESDAFLPNSSLRTAIFNWCDTNGVHRPIPPSLESAKEAVERVCRAGSFRSGSSGPDNNYSSDVSGEWSASNSQGLNQIYENGSSSNKIGNTPQRAFQPRGRQSTWNHTWSEPQKNAHHDKNNSRESSGRLNLVDLEDRPASSSFSHYPASAAPFIHTAPTRHSSAVPGDYSRGQMPLQLTQTPASYGEARASASAEGNLENDAVEALIFKLGHNHVKKQEEGVVELRRITRISARHSVDLCDERIFVPLLQLMQSRYPTVQINAVAAVMNLSLERENKLKVARFGAIPFLVDVLKSGVTEAQEHAAGAIFSLALNDENKMAIGVLGAIPPLIHLLRMNQQGARRDAAMALYHLSFSQMNRSKLIKAGGVGTLLAIVKDERSDVVGRALCILCNIAGMQEGRVALAEKDAVRILVNLLTKGDEDDTTGGEGQERVNWAEVREHAAAALLLLSQQNFRFRAQASQAGALAGLQRLEVEGTPRAREKAAALLEILREPSRGRDGGLDNPATLYRRAYNHPGVDITRAESSVF